MSLLNLSECFAVFLFRFFPGWQKDFLSFYYDAEFKTKGFTLKAPKIRVKDTPSRVMVTVLAKVK